MQENKVEASPANQSTWQFSLAKMFVLTTLVAAACSLLFAMPDWTAFPLMVLAGLVIPPALVTAIIYGRGYPRTFAIGALFPTGPFLLVTYYQAIETFSLWYRNGLDNTRVQSDILEMRIMLGAIWVCAIVSGLVCLLTRRLVEKR